MNDNITKFPQRTKVVHITLEPAPPLPSGPFTVTIADAKGKMFEAVFPDASGDLPEDAMILSSGGPGIREVFVNLLTGALRITAGRPK